MAHSFLVNLPSIDAHPFRVLLVAFSHKSTPHSRSSVSSLDGYHLRYRVYDRHIVLSQWYLFGQCLFRTRVVLLQERIELWELHESLQLIHLALANLRLWYIFIDRSDVTFLRIFVELWVILELPTGLELLLGLCLVRCP